MLFIRCCNKVLLTNVKVSLAECHEPNATQKMQLTNAINTQLLTYEFSTLFIIGKMLLTNAFNMLLLTEFLQQMPLTHYY